MLASLNEGSSSHGDFFGGRIDLLRVVEPASSDIALSYSGTSSGF